MYRRHLLVPIAALVAAVLYRNRLRAYLKQASANVRAFDLPTAGMYDALVGTVLEGSYARVAGDVAAAYPRGTLLGTRQPYEPVARAGLAGEERDPVCGMRVEPHEALGYAYRGESYHFCSGSCRELFKTTPEYFLRAMGYGS